VLTVAATSFSITIAVLTLTSSTYGPRLVRNFIADRERCARKVNSWKSRPSSRTQR